MDLASILKAHWPRFAITSIEEANGRFRLAYDPAIAQAFASLDTGKDIELWPLWEAVKKIPTLLIRGEYSDLLPENVATQMQQTQKNIQKRKMP